ncbi:hypothetical protein AC249_AIPGENE12434 [Exaiptasia diaphana]|nr:hypothetical protein AC249_AIPGENE12434 [Exaiptasia diaphana]
MLQYAWDKSVLKYIASMKYVLALFIVGASFTLISTSSSLIKNATSTKDEDEMSDDSPLPSPAGLSFIGSGYDLIRGNPDGQDIANGGVDPGLLPAKRILRLSYKEDKRSDNNKYLVPDQIRFTVRDSCVSTKKHDIVANSAAYQKELKVSVSVEAEYEGLWSAAFSASASYENMNKATTDSEKVFYEERTVCIKGNAEYFIDMAFQEIFSVSEAFASAVCNLPPLYSEKTYTSFLKAWGTNVVIGADLGTKEILRITSSKSAFTSYALTNVSLCSKLCKGI